MSRIGKQHIPIPDGVTVTVDGALVTVKGPLGELRRKIESRHIAVKVENGAVAVTRDSDDKSVASLHGLYRALIANNVRGVKEAFTKSLFVKGVGYKCASANGKLTMNIGFSHTVEVLAPEGIKIECLAPVTEGKANVTEIKVSGIDRELIGHVAAKIKSAKKIEPYQGYGIRYASDVWIKKEGKTAGK
jgi:large subunit ribosomal protein L6